MIGHQSGQALQVLEACFNERVLFALNEDQNGAETQKEDRQEEEGCSLEKEGDCLWSVHISDVKGGREAFKAMKLVGSWCFRGEPLSFSRIFKYEVRLWTEFLQALDQEKEGCSSLSA